MISDERIIGFVKNLFGGGQAGVIKPSSLKSVDRSMLVEPTSENMDAAKAIFGHGYNMWLKSLGRKTDQDVLDDIEEERIKQDMETPQETLERLSEYVPITEEIQTDNDVVERGSLPKGFIKRTGFGKIAKDLR